jgi:hypothetical protein
VLIAGYVFAVLTRRQALPGVLLLMPVATRAGDGRNARFTFENAFQQALYGMGRALESPLWNRNLMPRPGGGL